ncbi:MAG: phosphatase PAP2 family protein [Chitinophagaceae bacterium]|nr:MAG: phosphatase PAP2 family protein [Chitinophagaceae bacterium]
MRIVLLLLFSGTTAFCQIEPTAGKWKTWVVKDFAMYKLPPPPDKQRSIDELAEIRTLQGTDSAGMRDKVLYWNAGSPGYRWNNMITALSRPGVPPFREMALLNVAIYDATVVAWDAKYRFNRSRPGKEIRKYIEVPQSPSYPCEHAVTAGAASVVMAYLFPDKADSFRLLADELCRSRVASGVQYPSDVSQGFALGKKIGEEIIKAAKADRSDVTWTGSRPKGEGYWSGPTPVGVNYGFRKLYVLDSSSQFRPPPPGNFTKDMDELKKFKATQLSQSRAFYYATREIWADLVSQKIFEYNLQHNPPRAARVYALKSIALHDALIACWEAKYHYWALRPDEFDTTYKHDVITPPFPGYPSGHATTSSAVATVMGYLFPAESEKFRQLARECAESRFEGGIHFRTDNEVGLEMGEKIGRLIISRIKNDGAGR